MYGVWCQGHPYNLAGVVIVVMVSHHIFNYNFYLMYTKHKCKLETVVVIVMFSVYDYPLASSIQGFKRYILCSVYKITLRFWGTS
jgi:hypothetical protein